MGKAKETKEVHINQEFLRPVRMIMFIIRYDIVRSCTELRKKVLFKLGDAMTKIPKTKPTSLHVVVVIY